MSAASAGVLDAHVHVWDTRIFDYPWLADVPELPRVVLPSDVMNDGVNSVIFVQAEAAAHQASAEVEWVSQLEWPSLVGVVAHADLRSPHLGVRLDELAGLTAVVGVRHMLQGQPEDAFRDSTLRGGLALVGEHGLTFDACVTHSQLSALVELIDAVPETKVVIDHLGKPPVDAGISSTGGRMWADAMRRLSVRETTHVKLSGLSAESRDEKAFTREAPSFVAHVLECFGPDRCMIGSDAPVSTHVGPGGPFAAWSSLVQDVVGVHDWPAVSRGSAHSFYLPGRLVTA